MISVAFASYKGEGNQNLNFSVPSNYLAEFAAAAGYVLPRASAGGPQPAAAETANPFIAHVQKSWQILKRLLQKII